MADCSRRLLGGEEADGAGPGGRSGGSCHCSECLGDEVALGISVPAALGQPHVSGTERQADRPDVAARWQGTRPGTLHDRSAVKPFIPPRAHMLLVEARSRRTVTSCPISSFIRIGRLGPPQQGAWCRWATHGSYRERRHRTSGTTQPVWLSLALSIRPSSRWPMRQLL